jgi:hypothetical protein
MADSYNMLVVKLFNNAEGASRYLQDIKDNSDEILSGIAPAQYRMMIISRDNLGILLERKELTPYYLFYLQHYTGQEQ